MKSGNISQSVDLHLDQKFKDTNWETESPNPWLISWYYSPKPSTIPPNPHLQRHFKIIQPTKFEGIRLSFHQIIIRGSEGITLPR